RRRAEVDSTGGLPVRHDRGRREVVLEVRLRRFVPSVLPRRRPSGPDFRASGDGQGSRILHHGLHEREPHRKTSRPGRRSGIPGLPLGRWNGASWPARYKEAPKGRYRRTSSNQLTTMVTGDDVFCSTGVFTRNRRPSDPTSKSPMSLEEVLKRMSNRFSITACATGDMTFLLTALNCSRART